MPIRLSEKASTLLIRKQAFESAGLVRAGFDDQLGLTDEEFKVEGDLIAIGPIFDTAALIQVVEMLDRKGLSQFDDYFELSGNWPDWLSLFAMEAGG
jgi:hypothetical protein